MDAGASPDVEGAPRADSPGGGYAARTSFRLLTDAGTEMRNQTRPSRWMFAGVLVASVLLGIAEPGSASTGHAGTPTCALRIVGFAFQPPYVHGGEDSTAWVAARNCTDRTLDLTRTVYGEQIPPCPTIDPLASGVTIGPNARYVAKALQIVAPDCTGVEVLVVNFADQHGTIVAHATATLHIRTP
jgi:hypothetical protein